MCQINYTTKNKKWEQLTKEKRILIEYLYNIQHKNYTEIARELSVHRTTISREIKQGIVKNLTSELKEKLVYSASVGQYKNELNETAKGPMLKIGNDIKLAKYIEEEIKNKMSPEVISYKIKKNEEFKIKIHWKTIYNYIDKKILEIGRKELTYGNYASKKKDIKEENEIRKYNKRGKTIHDRPEYINTREEIGHWEMDLVEGLKGNKEPYLLVLSERKTRKEKIRIIADKTQKSVIKALDKIEKETGIVKFREIYKSITTDNGSEFLDWKGIERSYTKSKKKRVMQYYADAYSSWQRGTNENINKMIRRFLPKGSSFKDLKEEDVERIEKWINNYPRKMFNYKTSEEIYNEEVA